MYARAPSDPKRDNNRHVTCAIQSRGCRSSRSLDLPVDYGGRAAVVSPTDFNPSASWLTHALSMVGVRAEESQVNTGDAPTKKLLLLCSIAVAMIYMPDALGCEALETRRPRSKFRRTSNRDQRSNTTANVWSVDFPQFIENASSSDCRIHDWIDQ